MYMLHNIKTPTTITAENSTQQVQHGKQVLKTLIIVEHVKKKKDRFDAVSNFIKILKLAIHICSKLGPKPSNSNCLP